MENKTKIITEYLGKTDLKKIENYISIGGYESLEKFVVEISPKKAIKEIKISGLCGRGGAGFPTGEKMEMVFKIKSEEKYLICNLDESEPGTYKDRFIVDNNPHLLIEGIIITALIIGAKKAFIYINGSYKDQAVILEKALRDAKEEKFLGEKIFGSDEYGLEIEVFEGAGAYICGEETALIDSIEGNRGEPKMRPPYPTERGLFGKPTLINNAETICSIPWIISNGGEAYSKIGSRYSPGTKLFSIGGAVANPGVYEAPTGITLKEAIELAGGMKLGKDFWFAQLGGSSGRILKERDLNAVLEFKKDAEFSLGSGAILVVDKSTNIHDLLLSWTGFFRRESCGKCVPCREGTFRLWEIAKRLQDGEISERDEQAIDDILWTLQNTTFCPLGKFAATAFQDAMKNFKEEIFKKVK